MPANRIREILMAEALYLSTIGHVDVARSLERFAGTATDEQLVRFRQIMMSA